MILAEPRVGVIRTDPTEAPGTQRPHNEIDADGDRNGPTRAADASTGRGLAPRRRARTRDRTFGGKPRAGGGFPGSAALGPAGPVRRDRDASPLPARRHRGPGDAGDAGTDGQSPRRAAAPAARQRTPRRKAPRGRRVAPSPPG